MNWLCLDCRSVAEADTHGRCSTCGSVALCEASPNRSGIELENLAVEELERLYLKS